RRRERQGDPRRQPRRHNRQPQDAKVDATTGTILGVEADRSEAPRQRRRLRRELNQYPSRRARTFLPSERSSPTNPRASEASCGTMPPPTRGLVGEDRSLGRSEEHTSELQSRGHLVCRLLLEKKK